MGLALLGIAGSGVLGAAGTDGGGILADGGIEDGGRMGGSFGFGGAVTQAGLTLSLYCFGTQSICNWLS